MSPSSLIQARDCLADLSKRTYLRTTRISGNVTGIPGNMTGISGNVLGMSVNMMLGISVNMMLGISGNIINYENVREYQGI